MARSFSELVHALEVLLVLELGAPGAVALGFVLVRARRRTLDHLRGNGQLLLLDRLALEALRGSGRVLVGFGTLHHDVKFGSPPRRSGSVG